MPRQSAERDTHPPASSGRIEIETQPTDPILRTTRTSDVEPDLGVVVPAYNEETNLPVLVEELIEAFEGAGLRGEILFVDDGSRDTTAEVIRRLARAHACVRGLRLSRNFGHQVAVSTGLLHVRGAAVAVMDADLQDRPEDLIGLYRCWEKGGVDVAYAVRRTRQENIFKRAAYKTFYRTVAAIAQIDVPLDSGDFCIMDRAFVEQLNALPERLRFVRGLRAWLGGNQVPVPVDRDARRSGEPQYTMSKLIRLALDGLVSFSDAPLRLASILGLIVSGSAFAGIFIVLAWKLMGLLPEHGATATIALSVLFLGGIQLLTIGILGEYIGRIFEEVKARPISVIAEEMGGPAEEIEPE